MDTTRHRPLIAEWRRRRVKSAHCSTVRRALVDLSCSTGGAGSLTECIFYTQSLFRFGPPAALSQSVVVLIHSHLCLLGVSPRANRQDFYIQGRRRFCVRRALYEQRRYVRRRARHVAGVRNAKRGERRDIWQHLLIHIVIYETGLSFKNKTNRPKYVLNVDASLHLNPCIASFESVLGEIVANHASARDIVGVFGRHQFGGDRHASERVHFLRRREREKAGYGERASRRDK